MENITEVIQHPLVITLISTILGAIIAFYIAKWQMKRIIIKHKFEGPFDIGKGLNEVFPEFSLMFKGKPLESNVKVIKGELINESTRDISTLKDHGDFNLVFPSSSELIAAKCQYIGDDKIEIKRDPQAQNIITFVMPSTILSNEGFKYYVIFISPDDEKFEVKMCTRIPNVEIKGEKINDGEMKFTLLMLLVPIVLAFLTSLLGFNFLSMAGIIYIVFIVFICIVIIIEENKKKNKKQ